MSALEYICVECGRREVDAPLEVHFCPSCGRPCHPDCKAPHAEKCWRLRACSGGCDANGLDALRRFDLIRGWLLSETARAAASAAELSGIASLAMRLDLPTAEIERAIQRAVDHATSHGRAPQSVTFQDVERLLDLRSGDGQSPDGSITKSPDGRGAA